MDSLGWIIVAILILLFGKNIAGIVSTATAGVFTQPNAVPTPDGLPASTTQDQTTGNPVPTPAPWKNTCQVVAGQMQPTAVGLGLITPSSSNLNLPPSGGPARPVGVNPLAKATLNAPSFFQ